jgi:hypothetical protein
MDNFKRHQKYIGIFGILLFGLSIITLGKYNISKLFTTPLGRIWLLFLLIGTSIYNYKLGGVLLILILLLHTYLNTIEGMDTLNKPDTKKVSVPPPPQQTKEIASTPPPSTISASPASTSTTKPKLVVPPVKDENRLLRGEGANLLDIERNITKNSNSLQVTNKQDTENVLPSNPGKEAFQSNYQLL